MSDLFPELDQQTKPKKNNLFPELGDSNVPRGTADNSGMWDKAMAAVKNYQQSQMAQANPQALLTSANDILKDVAAKGADTFKEQYPDLSPIIEKPIEKVIKYAPDIAMLATPEAGLDVDKFASKAQEMGAKAVGFTKRYLNTPQKLAKAKQTAQILLDHGVINPLGTTEEMATKAKNLAEAAGQNIGDYLKSVGAQGKFFNLEDSIDSLEGLRPRSEDGTVLQGGHYDAINSKIDKAIDTIKAHLPDVKKPNNVLGANVPQEPPLTSFEEANKIKGQLQSAANYESNKDATLLDKFIASNFRKSIDSSLEKVAGTPENKEAYQGFLENKKIYGAAQHAIDPIFNRISSELGNKGVSLTDWILAAPELAMGNPVRALAAVGGKKALQKYGAQASAVILDKLAKANPMIGLKTVASREASRAIPHEPIIPDQGVQYLQKQFPVLSHAVSALSHTFQPKELREAITDATATAEAAKIQGMSNEQAERLALDKFLRKKSKIQQ